MNGLIGHHKLVYPPPLPPWVPVGDMSLRWPGILLTITPVLGRSLVLFMPWHGLVLAGFWNLFFYVSPSLVILFPMQGTICTTLVGVVSSLEDESSYEEF